MTTIEHENYAGYGEILEEKDARIRELEEQLEAADRLEFEVRYFDDHKPEECAIIRAADAYRALRGTA